MNKIVILSLLVLLTFAQDQAGVVVVPNQQLENDDANPGEYQIKDGVYILSENTFKNALQEFDFVLVKFFAPWCGHCKTLAPTYIEVAQVLTESGSPAKIAQVDCTAHQSVCQQKGIRGYPTMLFFKKGVDASQKYAGARSSQAMLKWIGQKVNPSQQNLGEL